MLDIKRVLASAPKKHDKGEPARLYTKWGEEIVRVLNESRAEVGFADEGASDGRNATEAARVLPGHPHPQFARDRFEVLNGIWDCAFVACDDAVHAWRVAPIPDDLAFSDEVLVPFTPGTLLSGVDRVLKPNELLWYRRKIVCPELGLHERCLLHFEAVDYACVCYCNGQRVGEHVGGYLPFVFDITEVVRACGGGETNIGHGVDAGFAAREGIAADGKAVEIALCVFDPTDAGVQLRGKQQLESGGIWYTPQGGIWQTVWLEVVPEKRIEKLSVSADAKGYLSVSADLSAPGEVLALRVLDAEGAVLAEESLEVGDAGCAGSGSACAGLGASEAAFEAAAAVGEGASKTTRSLIVHVRDAHLWSVEDPYLYTLELRYGEDEVRSYCGFRTVSMEEDAKGVKRLCLNGKPVFLRGVLDQGYWSDGLLTAPSDEALVYDIEAMKALGFNMLRKHIKVESDRWYYHCDRLGMLVWQDAVTGGGAYDAWHTSYKPTVFKASWKSFGDENPKGYAKLSAGSAEYRREWEETCLGMVDYLGGHPCIVAWVLFNEAWGQFEARKMTKVVRAADPTRAIDSVSGWYDQRCGDFHSVHNYFRDLAVWKDHAKPEEARDCFNTSGKRAFVISEFGGLTFGVAGHCMFEGSYGYENFEDLDAWRKGVRDNLSAVDALEGRGLAGFVYTQVSDVEEEINGLLTFDRRVNKLAGE